MPLVVVEQHRRLTGVLDVMALVGGAVHHAAGGHLHRLAVDHDDAGALGDEQELLFRMGVRRMRFHPGFEQEIARFHELQLIGGAGKIDGLIAEGVLLDGGLGGGERDVLEFLAGSGAHQRRQPEGRQSRESEEISSFGHNDTIVTWWGLAPTNLSSDLVKTALGAGSDAVAASRAMFRDWVEPLADSFTLAGVREYVTGFAEVIARALPELSAARIVERYERVREPRKYAGDAAAVKDVVILSRVTLGADVAVTSVVMDAARQAFPRASLHLAGNAKNAELFAAEDRVHHLAVPYARTGSLHDRLKASASLASVIPAGAVVLDPDSRLSQLGLVSICDDERYFFFESRAAGEHTDFTVGELAAQWCEQCFGIKASAWIAPKHGLGGEPRICVSLGTGENPDKGLGSEFEAELVWRLAARGQPLLIDKGMGADEGRRVERAVAASGVAAGQIRTWLGSFAPFAFEITRAPLYVGYDSAGQHVAAAAQTPLRCIFAGAPSTRFFDRWKPWGRTDNRVVRVHRKSSWTAALDELRLAQ